MPVDEATPKNKEMKEYLEKENGIQNSKQLSVSAAEPADDNHVSESKMDITSATKEV